MIGQWLSFSLIHILSPPDVVINISESNIWVIYNNVSIHVISSRFWSRCETVRIYFLVILQYNHLHRLVIFFSSLWNSDFHFSICQQMGKGGQCSCLQSRSHHSPIFRPGSFVVSVCLYREVCWLHSVALCAKILNIFPYSLAQTYDNGNVVYPYTVYFSSFPH